MANPHHSEARLFVLRNDILQVTLASYGARIVEILAPDRSGTQANIVLTHASLEAFQTDRSSYLGAIVGRFANRIAQGRFTLDGVIYQLPLNNGPNNLHAGPEGFDRLLWTAEKLPDAVEFTLTSPAGDQGFPGTLTVKARYSLNAQTLRLDLTAVTDAATVVNLASHAYFNLSGDPTRTTEDHLLQLHASRYTPTDAASIPTGELAPVDGTPFDFRTPTAIGQQMQKDHPQLRQALGFDHNYVLDAPTPSGSRGDLTLAAVASHPLSGRTLSVHTTEPGLQFYTGNHLTATHAPRTGFCLETQHFPDSPNHPYFPSTVLRRGETFRSATTFTFTVSD